MPGLELELKVQSESAEGTSLAQLQKPQVSVQCLERIARVEMSPFGSASAVRAGRCRMTQPPLPMATVRRPCLDYPLPRCPRRSLAPDRRAVHAADAHIERFDQVEDVERLESDELVRVGVDRTRRHLAGTIGMAEPPALGFPALRRRSRHSAVLGLGAPHGSTGDNVPVLANWYVEALEPGLERDLGVHMEPVKGCWPCS